MKSHWSKKTTNREMISLKQEDEGKKLSKSKSISKTLSRCSFLIFFCMSQSSLYQKCFFEDFFWVGDMTLVLLETTFNPTLNTQFMAGNYIRVIGCLSSTLLVLSMARAFCKACEDKRGFRIVCLQKIMIFYISKLSQALKQGFLIFYQFWDIFFFIIHSTTFYNMTLAECLVILSARSL